VHGDREFRFDPVQVIHALGGIHRDRVPEHPGAAQMNHGHIDVRVTIVNGVQVLTGQRVARHHHPPDHGSVHPVLQQAAHDRWQQSAHQPSGMDRRQGLDRQFLRPVHQRMPLPVLQAVSTESIALQAISGRRSGDDRCCPVETGPGHPIEMITVQVREDDTAQWRQCVHGQGRFGQPPRPQPLAQVGPLAPAQEVGVGEDGEPAQPNDRGRCPHEGQLGRTAISFMRIH
jgi:hypothetical protein